MEIDIERSVFWAKRIIPVAVIVLSLGYCAYEPSASWKGSPAPKVPEQTAIDLPPAFQHGKYTITPLANYSITAVVLGRENYYFDAAADLCSVDLALGWGPMSFAENINSMRITQSGRWYHYEWNNETTINPEEIGLHSANTHCIAGSKQVERVLSSVKKYDLVIMEGYLISASRGDGSPPWTSSLSRHDTGGGACEIMWITKMDRKRLR